MISNAERIQPQARIIDLDSKLGYELCMPIVIKVLQDIFNKGQTGSRSSIVDVTSVSANIYGCEPCPNCHSKFRYIANDLIQCDDCGFEEKITKRKKL